MLSFNIRIGLVFIAILWFIGCNTHSQVKGTIPSEFFANGTDQSEVLIIFLPGRGDDIEAFKRAGFNDILRRSNYVADSVVVDAHLGYYENASLPERIYEDILLPYQKKGYQRFVIVGVSLGGYGALWLSHEYQNLVWTVVLLAPYLGPESLIKKIESSDSIHAWRSEVGPNPTNEEKLWIWIDDMGETGTGKIKTSIIGIGRYDRFSSAAELFSTLIPDSHMFRNNGGHNWQTWRSLWLEITKSHSWELLGYTE